MVLSICNYLYYLKLQTIYFQDVSCRDSSRNEPCGVDVKMAETSLVYMPQLASACSLTTGTTCTKKPYP